MEAMLAILASVPVVAAAGSMVVATRRRWPLWWVSEPVEHRRAVEPPEDEGDDGLAGVREPRRPLPSGDAAAGHAEPDERAA
jgi:hypothetical protein